MNEDTKQILKWGSTFLASAIIGGAIGGVIGGAFSNCCCCKCAHHMGRGVPAPHFMHPRGPEFQGKFIQEEYIVVPKGDKGDFNKPPMGPEGKPGKMNPHEGKKTKHFDGPKPQKPE